MDRGQRGRAAAVIRRIPLFATAIVLIAAGIMIRLGFWQLDRLHEKAAMLARFSAAQQDTAVHRWPAGGALPTAYSRVALDCRVEGISAAEAGRNAAGQSGWVHVVGCLAPGGDRVRVVLGWAAAPAPVRWSGGALTGTYVSRDGHPVVFADPPLAGLQANARPDPRDLPNNHLAYAVQWFLFAAVALVIYGLALRKRLRGQ